MTDTTFLYACPALLCVLVAATGAGCMMDDDGEPCATSSSSKGGSSSSEGGEPGNGGASATGGGATGGGATGGGGAQGGSSPAPTGLRIHTESGPAPADLSCLEIGTAPQPGPMASFTLDARAFGMVDDMGEPVVVPGLEVQIFADNTIPDAFACGAGCTAAVDNGDGSYTFEAPSTGWLAYRVLERAAGNTGPAVLRTMEVNFTPGPEEGLNTILEPVLDGLHASLQIPRDNAAALIAGRMLDCNGDFIEGARVSLRDMDGNSIPFDDQTRAVYIDTTGPDPTLDHTTFAGQWSMTNVPADAGHIFVEVRAANGVLVGCELAPANPSAMSVVRITPRRADGPTGCTP